jgi:ComF family protein
MKEFLLSLLDWIYKKKCYFCKSSKECVRMCPKCYDKLRHLPVKVERIIDGVNVYSCGVYSKELQKLIRGLKFHNQRDLAYYLAKFMHEYAAPDGEFTVVPVPIHPKRRKYNHMDLVGEEFCKLSGSKLNCALVKRVKDTRPQYKLSKKERAKNLAGAFEICSAPAGRILIIDDICTTGATFEELIREFKKYGINNIVCLAAATPHDT